MYTLARSKFCPMTPRCAPATHDDAGRREEKAAGLGCWTRKRKCLLLRHLTITSGPKTAAYRGKRATIITKFSAQNLQELFRKISGKRATTRAFAQQVSLATFCANIRRKLTRTDGTGAVSADCRVARERRQALKSSKSVIQLNQWVRGFGYRLRGLSGTHHLNFTRPCR